jgi:hypothetical protein
MESIHEEELMVERGNAAENLLRSDVFTAACTALINLHMGSILTSPPESTSTREAGYFQARAVQDIVGVLNQWVAIRDQIIANNDHKDIET